MTTSRSRPVRSYDVGNILYFESESATPLLATHHFEGATIDTWDGAKEDTDTIHPGRYATIRGTSSSDQTGTLAIQQSPDGVTWYQTQSVSVAAAVAGTDGVSTTAQVLESLIAMRYVRVTYLNGGTNQTTFFLGSCLVAV